MDTTMFKDKPLEKRREIYRSLMKEKSDRIAVIMNKGVGDGIAKLQKKKYLLPPNMKLANFTQEIRNRLKLDSRESLFVMFNGKIYNAQQTMSEIYNMCRDPEDGFLYGTYNTEVTFG